jgi:hypothetical protein
MKQKTHIIKMKQPDNIIQIKIDISTVPSPDRKYSRLKNKSQVFDDRRRRKPKYKLNYMED